MKDSNSFVYNVWLIILLVAAYVWPIFGIVPAIYLFIKRKDEQLEKMQGWITLALIWQIVLWLLMIIALVSMVESTGVFFALGDLLGKDITEDDLKRGYRAEGLAQIFGGLFNTFPYTTFSQNVGLLQLSGIRSKRPIYWAAGLLMAMGLLPKVGALVTIMPTAVLGGAMVVMFSSIAVQGIKMLLKVDFSDNHNLLIVAISLGLGLGVSVYPTIFQALPSELQLFLENGIVIASISSVLLNLIFKGKKGLDEK